MAQQLKVLVTKPDDLNLVPGTHLVEGENQLLEALPDSHHVSACPAHSPFPNTNVILKLKIKT